MITPVFSEDEYNQGRPQLICRKLIADLETPVSTFLKVYDPANHAVLLESVQGGESRGRYSIIALDPDLIIRSADGRTYIDNLTDKTTATYDDNPLDILREFVSGVSFPIPAEMPPMASGLFGFISYDAVRFAENIPLNTSGVTGYDFIFMRARTVIVFDNVADEISMFRLIMPKNKVTSEEALKEAEAELAKLEGKIARQLIGHRASYGSGMAGVNYTPAKGDEKFYSMVEKAKEYILAGDIFQVVLSESFESEFYLPPFSLYRALRHLNPSPFLVFMNFIDFQLVSSSPEIMVRLRDGKVTIRPIAGTRKRGRTLAEDRELAEDLLNDPKELSEHLMLLDLGRNDVGRVAKTGTVKVTERMIVENYSHVMHLVSNVEGEAIENLSPIDALIAGLPAGTLSGAPKIRAMEIIAELEQDSRGFYGGCMGYIGAGGNMDTCITIRTALIKDNRLYTRAGAGIVAESVPQSEYQECLNKATAIFRAAAEAARFL